MRASVPRSRSKDSRARSSVTLLTKTETSQLLRRRPARRLTRSYAGIFGVVGEDAAVSGAPIVLAPNDSRLSVPRSSSPTCVKREPMC